MKSPLYSSVTMEQREIEPGLVVYRCPKSEGIWISLQSYLAWLKSGPPAGSTGNESAITAQVDDAKRQPLFCPESGSMLARYRVGHALGFQIDRSPVTGGVWLDKGEWEALKAKGLHDDLHLIFTAPYQKAIRAASLQEQMIASFKERVGEADFEKVDAFKGWMASHEQGRAIRAFLLEAEL
ncbi:hypothetical protein BH09VER1_BH09VER1_21260 [soil metagenome]